MARASARQTHRDREHNIFARFYGLIPLLSNYVGSSNLSTLIGGVPRDRIIQTGYLCPSWDSEDRRFYSGGLERDFLGQGPTTHLGCSTKGGNEIRHLSSTLDSPPLNQSDQYDSSQVADLRRITTLTTAERGRNHHSFTPLPLRIAFEFLYSRTHQPLVPRLADHLVVYRFVNTIDQLLREASGEGLDLLVIVVFLGCGPACIDEVFGVLVA